MIIEPNKAFFFHIPKVAGYAIEQYFIPGDRDWQIFREDILFGIHNGIMTQHFTYNEAIQYKSESTLNSYFKFAFFRNTWERFASAFFYYEDSHLFHHGNFDNFVHNTCKQVNNYTNTNGWHFAKQTDWLYDRSNNICLDYIGRYETLNEDLKKICDKIGREYTTLPRKNQSKLSIQNINYRDIYSETTKNLIKETYKEEIDFFDYKF